MSCFKIFKIFHKLNLVCLPTLGKDFQLPPFECSSVDTKRRIFVTLNFHEIFSNEQQQ